MTVYLNALKSMLTIFASGVMYAIVNNHTVEAGSEQTRCLQVKVGECQCDSFAHRDLHHPHTLSVGGIVHGPVVRFDDSSLLTRKTTTALDFWDKKDKGLGIRCGVSVNCEV